MTDAKPSKISIVLASWCPHCDPLSLNYTKRISEETGIPYSLLDIDKEGSEADALVREKGDYCEDYLVPQVFIEYSDGTIKHLFTGFSESTEVTRRHWDDFLQSQFYHQLRKKQ